jgi:hypothetical protein
MVRASFKVLTAVLLKIHGVCVVKLYCPGVSEKVLYYLSLVYLALENKRCTLLRNVGKPSTNASKSHRRRLESPSAPVF